MAEKYTVGDRYYLPVVVDEIDEDADYALNLRFIDGRSGDYARVMDKPGLLLTADEIADAKYEEIKKRYDSDVVELGGEIKTLKYENERLSKQNEELVAKVDDLEAELNNARHVNEYAVETAQNKEKLIGELRELIKKYGMVIDILLDKITALKKGESNG